MSYSPGSAPDSGLSIVTPGYTRASRARWPTNRRKISAAASVYAQPNIATAKHTTDSHPAIDSPMTSGPAASDRSQRAASSSSHRFGWRFGMAARGLRCRRGVAALGLLAALTGCAAVPAGGDTEPNDPLEPFTRAASCGERRLADARAPTAPGSARAGPQAGCVAPPCRPPGGASRARRA